MTTLDNKALEAAVKALCPDLFSDVEQVRYHAAFPMSVTTMQERYRHQAETMITAYLDALSSIPEQGVKADTDFDEVDAVERMLGAVAHPFPSVGAYFSGGIDAWRDMFRSALLLAAPSHPAAVGVTDEMVEAAWDEVPDFPEDISKHHVRAMLEAALVDRVKP